MIVYDIANGESFEHCRAWLEDVRENVSATGKLPPCIANVVPRCCAQGNPGTVVMIVGNKKDQRPQIDRQTDVFADSHDCVTGTFVRSGTQMSPNLSRLHTLQFELLSALPRLSRFEGPKTLW